MLGPSSHKIQLLILYVQSGVRAQLCAEHVEQELVTVMDSYKQSIATQHHVVMGYVAYLSITPTESARNYIKVKYLKGLKYIFFVTLSELKRN